MARIRTIKPEFWTSEQVMECSPNARLAFIGMWNFCDDVGRMPASPKQIKALVFPSDDFTSENVRGMIDELEANGLLRRYVVDGKEFIAVTGWHHQKIDKPQRAKTPEPPGPNDDSPPPIRRTFGVGREGNTEGKRKGEESKSGGGGDSHPARPLLNEAVSEPAVAVEPAPPRSPDWNSRANFDRVEARCRRELPEGWVNDFVVGPMVKLEHDGLDLEAEIVPAIIDLVASRRVPIRTWGTLANAIAEKVQIQRETRSTQGLPAKPAAPTPDAEMVEMAPHGRWPEQTIRNLVGRHRDNPGSWIEAVFGPPPGQPGCRVPARLLIGEAA